MSASLLFPAADGHSIWLQRLSGICAVEVNPSPQDWGDYKSCVAE
jgi:hypothetical protein